MDDYRINNAVEEENRSGEWTQADPAGADGGSVAEGRVTVSGVGVSKTVVLAVCIALLAVILGLTGWGIHMKNEAAREAEALAQKELELKALQAEQELILSEQSKVDLMAMSSAVTAAQDLVTTKFFYEAVGDYTKDKKFFSTGITIPFTTDETLFVYEGRIGIGVDVSRISFDVRESERIIVVRMPRPAILFHEIGINSLRVYNVKDSIFTEIHMEDYAGLQEALKAKEESDVKADAEVWESARKSAESTVENLLRGSQRSLADYHIVFVWSK